MSGGFSSPLIGGGGGLVYPSIHSPNFAAGSAGWQVSKDGSSEFDNATLRGSLTVENAVLNLLANLASGKLTLSQITGSPGEADLGFITGSSFELATPGAGLTAVDNTSLLQALMDLLASDGVSNGQLNVYGFNPTAGDVTGCDLNISGTLNAIIGGASPAIETWHRFGAAGQPAFNNSWANTAGVSSGFKLMADGSVRLYMDLTVPVAAPNTNIIAGIGTLYTPKSTQSVEGFLVTASGGTASVVTPRAFLSSAGNITAAGIPTGMTSARVIFRGDVDLSF